MFHILLKDKISLNDGRLLFNMKLFSIFSIKHPVDSQIKLCEKMDVTLTHTFFFLISRWVIFKKIWKINIMPLKCPFFLLRPNQVGKRTKPGRQTWVFGQGSLRSLRTEHTSVSDRLCTSAHIVGAGHRRVEWCSGDSIALINLSSPAWGSSTMSINPLLLASFDILSLPNQ